MQVQGNTRWADMLAAASAAKFAEQSASKLFDELKSQLSRIEAKRELHMKLTKEESAFWLLYGKR